MLQRAENQASDLSNKADQMSAVLTRVSSLAALFSECLNVIVGQSNNARTVEPEAKPSPPWPLDAGSSTEEMLGDWPDSLSWMKNTLATTLASLSRLRVASDAMFNMSRLYERTCHKQGQT